MVADAVEWALVFQVSVRCTAAVSGIASVFLFRHCARLTRRPLLVKQVMHLAFVNLLAFLWKAFFPFTERHCDLEEKVFKYLVGVSITTHAWIACSTLVAVQRCMCVATLLEKHGVTLLLFCWPLAAVLLMPFFMSEAHYERSLGLCVESRMQVVNEMIAGGAFLPAVFVPYLFTLCRARRHSPHSVASAYLRTTLGLMTVALLTFVPFLGSLVYEALDMPHEGHVHSDQTIYMIGQIALCSNGMLCALAYGVQRVRCCGQGQPGNFTVAYNQNVEVFDISNTFPTDDLPSLSSKGSEPDNTPASMSTITPGRSVSTESILLESEA